MSKNLLYKKLVRQFESAINDYQNVNAELDVTKLEKIIAKSKKNNRYYSGLQQFLVYLRKFKDENQHIFIFSKMREKYECLLEKVNLLLNFNQLKKQTSRDKRQTKNCLTHFDMAVYLNDLQKSHFYSIFQQIQILKLRFGDTTFILKATGISRQGLDENDQTMCRDDYEWLLESMVRHFIEKRLRAEAQKHGSSLDDADIKKIVRNIYLRGGIEQNNRQLMGIDSLDIPFTDSHEFCLEKFIFNSSFITKNGNTLFKLNGGNNSDILSRINEAVRLEIAEFIKPKFFTQQTIQDNYSPNFPQSQSISASGILSSDTNTISSNQRSAEGLNGRTIALVVMGIGGIGIGIISIIVAGIRWFRKKPAQENLQSDRERIRLTTRQGEHKVRSQGARDRRALTGEAGHISRVRRTNLGDTTAKIVSEHSDSLFDSIPESLYIRRLVVQLHKRLEFLKELDRYASEIGVHYDSFRAQKNNEEVEVIENLKKIKQALTKFIAPKSATSKNKDKIISNKLESALSESALSIVESLMQRYSLLSLPNAVENKHNYLTDTTISGLKILVEVLIVETECITDGYKELDKLDKLVNCERAAYDANLIAHAEGYFEKYPSAQVINCLQTETNSNIKNNHKSELNKIEQLQANLSSSLKIIIDLFKELKDEFLMLGKIKFSNAANEIIMKLEPLKSQLGYDSGYYSGYCNARRDEASKLKPTQIFFRQEQSAQKIQSQPQQAMVTSTRKSGY